MTTWRRYLGVAGSAGLAAVMISMTMARPVIAANPKVVVVDDTTKEIFSNTTKLQFSTFGGACSDVPTVVPAGKRLVLEFLSVAAEMNGSDQLVLVEIRPSLGGDNRIFAAVVPTFGGMAGSPLAFRVYGASHPLKLYFDPTDNFMICAFKNGTNDAAFFDATVSGYYVNLP